MPINDFNDEQYLLDAIKKAIDNVYSNSQFNKVKHNYSLFNENERYLMNFNEYYNKCLDLVSDLDKIVVFIRCFPSKKYYENNDINQMEFIKYHLEVYFYKIHTLLDIMKKLLNALFEYGLSEKECTWNRLKTKNEILNSDFEKLILAYHNTFRDILEKRNLSSHDAHFEKEIEHKLIDSYLLINKLEDKYKSHSPGNKSSKIEQASYNFRILEYRKEQLVFVRRGINVANILVHKFLKVALFEFVKRHTSKVSD